MYWPPVGTTTCLHFLQLVNLRRLLRVAELLHRIVPYAVVAIQRSSARTQMTTKRARRTRRTKRRRRKKSVRKRRKMMMMVTTRHHLVTAAMTAVTLHPPRPTRRLSRQDRRERKDDPNTRRRRRLSSRSYRIQAKYSRREIPCTRLSMRPLVDLTTKHWSGSRKLEIPQ